MNRTRHIPMLLMVSITGLLLVACMAHPVKPEGADNLRSRLTQLQSDPQLASRAPVAVRDAEQAVRAAEIPQTDPAQAQHLLYIADRKIDIATARAQARLYEDQRQQLSQQREQVRLASRTTEADNARLAADEAQRKNLQLQQQIEALNAKTTKQGLVVTLGDLLFDTGKAELRGGTAGQLRKLAAFLNQYQERTLTIEGHTDNVGSANYNLRLSQSRANAVQAYLETQGVSAARMTTIGRGEESPVASNDTASGRQQNRRVDVIIANPQPDPVTKL